MANKRQVIDLHLAHPDWSARKIADELRTGDAYVRATARRYGLTLPRSTRTPMTPQQLRARAARLIAQAEAMEQQEND